MTITEADTDWFKSLMDPDDPYQEKAITQLKAEKRKGTTHIVLDQEPGRPIYEIRQLLWNVRASRPPAETETPIPRRVRENAKGLIEVEAEAEEVSETPRELPEPLQELAGSSPETIRDHWHMVHLANRKTRDHRRCPVQEFRKFCARVAEESRYHRNPPKINKIPEGMGGAQPSRGRYRSSGGSFMREVMSLEPSETMAPFEMQRLFPAASRYHVFDGKTVSPD